MGFDFGNIDFGDLAGAPSGGSTGGTSGAGLLSSLLGIVGGAVGGVAGAAPALAQAGATGYGAFANQQAANRQPNQTTVPLTPYQDALQRIFARSVALNMGKQPPTFFDWVGSGGTERFPYTDPGITPKGLADLGLVGPLGQRVPFTSTSGAPTVNESGILAEGGGLTPEQKLYLGYQYSRDPMMSKHKNLLARIYANKNRLQQVARGIEQAKAQGKVRKAQKLEAKTGRIQAKQHGLQVRLGDIYNLLEGEGAPMGGGK